ncbi:MAG: xanthine phosphoribosyltransferase [Clostridiales bacterium]|nr:xanthine phosphoribosyltransferase [Clostridiales bacterium]
METLKNRILAEGQAIGQEIIRVDSFLNHQIDAEFMYEIGEEFKKRFAGEEINKILTIEASGIAIAVCAAKFFGYPPVVFAKKDASGILTPGFYSSEAKSFTKGVVSTVKIAEKFLSSIDRILIIDDFLARGEAAFALCSLAEQAGAAVVGIGAVIEKGFQGGGDRLRKRGYRVESLAVIEKITGGKIIFKN